MICQSFVRVRNHKTYVWVRMHVKHGGFKADVHIIRRTYALQFLNEVRGKKYFHTALYVRPAKMIKKTINYKGNWAWSGTFCAVWHVSIPPVSELWRYTQICFQETSWYFWRSLSMETLEYIGILVYVFSQNTICPQWHFNMELPTRNLHKGSINFASSICHFIHLSTLFASRQIWLLHQQWVPC